MGLRVCGVTLDVRKAKQSPVCDGHRGGQLVVRLPETTDEAQRFTQTNRALPEVPFQGVMRS